MKSTLGDARWTFTPTVVSLMAMSLVLASSSPYRRELLRRLCLEFVVDSPDIDETSQPGETARELVERLSIQKAKAVARRHRDSLVIGSDQVLTIDKDIIGKPRDFSTNVSQLQRASGRRVEFVTGLCLLNSATGGVQSDVVFFNVTFRVLEPRQITSYVQRERPFDCAGGFKSEGLGISLFETMHGEDPTALIGLPLMKLVTMLKCEGVDVLTRTGLTNTVPSG